MPAGAPRLFAFTSASPEDEQCATAMPRLQVACHKKSSIKRRENFADFRQKCRAGRPSGDRVACYILAAHDISSASVIWHGPSRIDPRRAVLSLLHY